MYMYFIYKKMYSSLHGLPVQSFLIWKPMQSCLRVKSPQYNSFIRMVWKVH